MGARIFLTVVECGCHNLSGRHRGIASLVFPKGPCHINNTTVILIHYGGGKKYDGSRILRQSLAISALTEPNRQKSCRKKGFWARKSQPEIADR